MKNKEKTPPPLLKGYKRIGKRFVPPLMQLPKNNLVSYIDDILPEVVWIGLLNEDLGYVPAARILENLILHSVEVIDKDSPSNFAFMSCYTTVSNENKRALRERLDRDGSLETIQNGIAPLTLLYDNCPISFLGPPKQIFSRNELVAAIKQCIGRTIDKYATPGIVLNGSILLSQMVTGKLHVSSKITLPDLNSVIDSPSSDEAQRAAAFMRSFALTAYGMAELDSSWPKRFWNQSIELDSCEFMVVEGSSESI